MRTPFVIAIILFSLAISISSILKKHKGAEDHRQKIARDILILIATFVIVILIGGPVALWVGKQAEGQFGSVVGVLCALAASFVVGYGVRKGVGSLVR